jgi:hypothetical protein
VAWGKPDSPRRILCSYCQRKVMPFRSEPRLSNRVLGADDWPLMLWREDGASAQFCDECVERWIETQ